jgi:hypothetical protein
MWFVLEVGKGKKERKHSVISILRFRNSNAKGQCQSQSGNKGEYRTRFAEVKVRNRNKVTGTAEGYILLLLTGHFLKMYI